MNETIYKIRFATTPKVYIGVTGNFERRKKDHLYRLKRGCHESQDLQRHFSEVDSSPIFEELANCKTIDRQYFERLIAESVGIEFLFNQNILQPSKQSKRGVKPSITLRHEETQINFASIREAAFWVCAKNGVTGYDAMRLVCASFYSKMRPGKFWCRGHLWVNTTPGKSLENPRQPVAGQ